MKKNRVQKMKQQVFSRGIALLMVLASLAVLSGVVVEFAYNSNVTYNLAMNDLDRVQAYYLAQSGLNFSKLVLKYDKEAKKVADEASKKMGKSIVVPPLYEMIPINTAMIRGLAGLTEGGGEEAGMEEVTEESEETEESSLEQGLSMINVKGAKEFLAFTGDFSGEITEEDAKFNLNVFYALDPKKKDYDQFKSILYHLLANDEFEGLFEDRYRGAKEIAQNIVDFIDKDDVHNEPGGQQRGREGVGGNPSKTLKNAKLLSMEELILIPGMTDPIFQKLRKFTTIYGADGKVNICRAEEPLVKSLILAYTENNPKMEPLKDDNVELLDKAVEAVLNNCPDSAAMSAELDKVLGVVEESKQSSGTQTSTASVQGTTTTGTQPQSSTTQKFGDLVKQDSIIFTIVGIGTVGESEVKVKTVVDTSKGDARQWKELYWRVE